MPMSADRWRMVDRGPVAVPAASPSASPGASARTGPGWRDRARRVAFWLLDRVRGRLDVRVLRLRGSCLVLAESVDALTHALSTSRISQRTSVSRMVLVVMWWRTPRPGWPGRVGPIEGVCRQRLGLPRRGYGMATVTVAAAGSAPTATLLAAAADALRPRVYLPAGSLRGRAAATPPSTAVAEAGAGRVLIDAERVNPRGRRSEAYQPGAHWLTLEFGDRANVERGRRWLRGSGPTLSWPTIGALRTVAAVTCTRSPDEDPAGVASLLVQLAMTGVALHASGLPDPVSAMLASELYEMLAEPLPDHANPLQLELRSIRQRRAALRLHSRRFGTGEPGPTVTALLATRRPQHLPAALRSLLAQTYPSLEVVVCLHGIDLPVECEALLATSGRPYEVVTVPGEETFGTALGIASARASGSLLTKFDDDDTYGPDHVWDLVLARHYSGATLVGKGAEFVYLEDADLTIRRWLGRPESDDAIIAGGTMLIGKDDLDHVGGWPPVPRSVDRGLMDRIHRAGAATYKTHPVGYVYHRRAGGHTWNPGQEYFLRDVRQRWEGLIRLPDFGTAPAEAAAGGHLVAGAPAR